MGKTESKYKSLDKHLVEAVLQADLPRIRNLINKLPHYANKPLNNKLWTALIYAVISNRLEVVQVLVEEFKADVNISDLDGWTALTHCVYSNRAVGIHVARYLCAAGANILAKTKSNTTALDAAYGSEELVSFLFYYAKYGPYAMQRWHNKKKLLWVYKHVDLWKSLPIQLVREAAEFI